MSEWIATKLGEIVKTNTTSLETGYPFDKIQYLDTGSITRGKIEGFQEMALSEAPSRAKRLVKENDIIYSTVRPVQRHYGFITIPPENLVVSTGFAVITCNKERIDPKFLYHYLSSDKIVEELDIIADASTSTYPSLKPSDIELLDILMPSDVEEQRAIASVLTSLDDKIDVLHRQNKTLEAMAETLFRQWFVVEAKEGWEEGVLSDLCTNITKGTTPTTLGHQFTETGINFVKAESITDVGDFIKEKFAKIGLDTHEFLKRSILHNGDILCSIAGTIGRIAQVTNEILPANTNQAIAILRVDNSRCFPQFVYLFLKSPEFREIMDGKVVHAVQPNLSLGEIGNTKLRIPPRHALSQFELVIVPIFDKKNHNAKEIHTLERLRDTLLPKLMSGEVRVAA